MSLNNLDSDSLATLLHARYGQAASLPESASTESLLQQLAHRSVRRFAPRPLAQGVLEAAIAAAQSAATSSNLQQWSVVSVQSQAGKEAFYDLCNRQQPILEAPVFLVWLVDQSRLQALAAGEGQNAEALDYFETFVEGIVDATLAAQNAVVALESFGIGTVFIGSVRNHPEAIAKQLNLPPKVFPVFGLCVGYPAEDGIVGIKPRLPQTSILHDETYQAATTEVTDAFEAVTLAYQQREGRPETGWREPSLARITSAARFTGRERLKPALERLGIGLK
ncbi:MAG: nitroreductase family protein [Asticcacaulis sp.]